MIQNILCATDGTDHSDIAVEYAAQLAAKFGASLTVCVVNITNGTPRGPLIPHWNDAEEQAVVDRAAELARKNGATGAKAVAIASREASAGIVSYAEEHGFDQIVVGTGDKRGLSRLMIGSVAADVVARAHVSVTVAR